MGLRGMNFVLILWTRLQRLCMVVRGNWRHADKETVNNPKKLATMTSKGMEKEVLDAVRRHIYGAPQL